MAVVVFISWHRSLTRYGLENIIRNLAMPPRWEHPEKSLHGLIFVFNKYRSCNVYQFQVYKYYFVDFYCKL